MMKLRTVLLTAAALAAAACIGDLGLKEDTSIMGADLPPGPTLAATRGKAYSGQEVAAHNKQGDCWLVLHGKVYDITKFIPFHPGGNAILQGCGKDATTLFETRTMGSGTPHSSDARDMADRYYAGKLK